VREAYGKHGGSSLDDSASSRGYVIHEPGTPYNLSKIDFEELFDALVTFAQRLDEEELAVFDILTCLGPGLSAKEKKEVKRIAHELLDTLKAHKLALDWRKRQQSRAAAELVIQNLVWQLPTCYTDTLCKQKSADVYQHVYDSYCGAGQSVYAVAG
jgi:type I restriction enzyme R subunit